MKTNKLTERQKCLQAHALEFAIDSEDPHKLKQLRNLVKTKSFQQMMLTRDCEALLRSFTMAGLDFEWKHDEHGEPLKFMITGSGMTLEDRVKTG